MFLCVYTVTCSEFQRPVHVYIQYLVMLLCFCGQLKVASVHSPNTYCTKITIWQIDIDGVMREKEEMRKRPVQHVQCCIEVWHGAFPSGEGVCAISLRCSMSGCEGTHQ